MAQFHYTIYNWFGSNARIIIKDNKSYAIIKTDEDALFYWLLQYIEFFEIIEPLSLKNKIIKTLTETLEVYKKS